MAVSQSVSLTQTSQSVEGNYSYVTFKWTSTQSGASFNDYTRTAYYYVSINGGSETKYNVSYTLPKGTTKTIVNKSIKVAHKADGTGSIKIRTYMDTDISAGVVEKTVSKTLTTIPRATTPTVNDTSVNFGESVTVSMPRASNSFTHTLKYTFAGSTATIGSSLGTSKEWTIPLSLMNKIPNATSGTLTFTCETYNGNTKIGSKTVNITVNVPSTVIPTASLAVSEYVTNIKNIFGVYVKGLSRLSIKATGTGAYSSTIKSYKITANSETFTDASATTSVLKSSGSLTITVTVTDSRGRTGTKSTTVTVYDYNKPIIDVFEGVRCDADGTENDEGENVLLTLKGSVTNLTGNTATYKIGYKEASSSGNYNYTTLPVTSLSIDQTHIINNIDTEKAYYIQFIITDALGDGEPLTIPISTAFTLVDYHSCGKGMSIGKVAELEGVLDVALKTLSRGGYIMPVLDNGTDLNTVTTPNMYAGNASTTAGYINSPVTTATSFTLEVMSAGDNGQLMQRITTCTKTNPVVYERFYYANAWGDWISKRSLLESAVLDSGWKFPTLEGDFENYDSTNTVRYRKIGKMVEVRGAVRPTGSITGSTTNYTIFTLPENYRPSTNILVVCQGSKSYRWMLMINPAGLVIFSRYGDGGTYVDVDNTNWLPFQVTFFID